MLFNEYFFFRVWSCWGRDDERTNNNSEGLNSVMSKNYSCSHPYPHIALKLIMTQLRKSQVKKIKQGEMQLGHRTNIQNNGTTKIEIKEGV